MSSAEMAKEGRERKPKLDDLAATQIGRKLKAEFDSVVSEPVPDRFLSLLEKLEAAEKKKTGNGDDHE